MVSIFLIVACLYQDKLGVESWHRLKGHQEQCNCHRFQSLFHYR